MSNGEIISIDPTIHKCRPDMNNPTYDLYPMGVTWKCGTCGCVWKCLRWWRVFPRWKRQRVGAL